MGFKGKRPEKGKSSSILKGKGKGKGKTKGFKGKRTPKGKSLAQGLMSGLPSVNTQAALQASA
jgi:hypothetical protein